MNKIEIVEVGPRDGLQNESLPVSTAEKLALIEHAIDYGARRIEVTSFVNPARVPQLADADRLCAMLPKRDDVTYIGLVLNRRGALRAIEAGLDELGAVCVASDTFGIRNQGQSAQESLAVAMDSVALAHEAGKRGHITIAVAFGCPFEGETPIDRVVEMAKRATDAQPVEIAIADTMGVAVPAHVTELAARVIEAIAPLPLRLHFHDTRNTGIANVWAGVQAGAATIDSSLGGLGGCPFAPGAAGNVGTEDVAYLLARSGIATGLDLAKVTAASHWLSGVMGKTLPAMVSRAPAFPG